MNITILSQVFKISGDLIKSSNIIKFKIETNQKLLLKTSMEIIQHLAVTFLLNHCNTFHLSLMMRILISHNHHEVADLPLI